MEPANVRIGLVQMTCTQNTADNLDKAEAGIRDCAQKGAQIICLQELVGTLYFCHEESYEHFELAHASDGPIIERFQNLAKELATVIIVPFFERRASGVYHNSAAVLDGSHLGIYRKIRPR